MIIKDINGEKLALTKTTLTEVTGEVMPNYKWALKLRDLKKAFPVIERGVLYRTDEAYGDMEEWNPKVVGHITYNPQNRRIGCRTFSKKVFAAIRKAIKETK
jgi:hypothetical protein